MRETVKLIATIALMVSAMAASASPIRADFDANTFARNDDGSISVNTGINFDFFGLSGPEVYLNNNGNITFSEELGTYTPFGITGSSTPMIAPFFADVDTSSSTGGSPVTYGSGTVDGHNAFGFNWLNVGHYGGSSALNSFQLVFIERSDTGAGNFNFEFNYGSILWEAGTASDGDSNGLGGTSASAGYTNGAGTFFELPGSLDNGALLDSGPASTSLIQNSLNSNVSGRYVFSVRDSEVEDPTDVPEPGTLGLFALAMLALSRFRRG